jgi:16S rRNA (guanine527-N7)-methyltransferase
MHEQISLSFPSLAPLQVQQLSALKDLYKEWNDKINVISRKDFDNFEIHHLLHSLSIGLFFQFPAGSRIMDVGTGGGFPGIPLAILFPESEFTLVDSIAKKIRVVTEVKNALGLKNVHPIRNRVEDVTGNFDYITGRAVTALPEFTALLASKIKSNPKRLPAPGIIYLKGGDFTEELSSIQAKTEIYLLNEVFSDPFFETKKIIHIFQIRK